MRVCLRPEKIRGKGARVRTGTHRRDYADVTRAQMVRCHLSSRSYRPINKRNLRQSLKAHSKTYHRTDYTYANRFKMQPGGMGTFVFPLPVEGPSNQEGEKSDRKQDGTRVDQQCAGDRWVGKGLGSVGVRPGGAAKVTKQRLGGRFFAGGGTIFRRKRQKRRAAKVAVLDEVPGQWKGARNGEGKRG